MDKFEEIKNRLTVTEVIEFYTSQKVDRSGNILCPFHAEKTPSFSVKESKKMWKCFGGCPEGNGGDIITFVMQKFNLTHSEALDKLCEDFRVDFGKPYVAKTIQPTKPKEKINMPLHIQQSHDNVGKTKFFLDRGLTQETINRFKLGYDENRNALVIPYQEARSYFQWRHLDPNPKMRFEKPNTENHGAEPLWNPNALKLKTRKPIFVVESPLCAISIIQAGGMAVSICGGNFKAFEDALKNPPKGALVICMDNDKAGDTKRDRIKGFFESKQIRHIVRNISDECNDPNELLMKDPKRFQHNVLRIQEEGWYLNQSKHDSEEFGDILDMKFPPRVWLVDKMISIGLALIAAPPKIGKSYMMLQLLQCIREGTPFLGHKTFKHEVEYLALEDDKQRINERGHQQRQGRPLSAEARRGMRLSHSSPTMDNQELLNSLAEKLDRHPNTKIFIIDTLQKIRRTKNLINKDYQMDYDEIGLLKQFADDNKIAIVLIHHTRKAVDEVDPFNNILGNTGLQGVVDTVMVINNRKENQTTLFVKGRDVGQNALIIEHDDEKKGGTGLWHLVGTPEEQAELVQKSLYENNPIVITIKELLKQNGGRWEGRVTDFMFAQNDITGSVTVANAKQIGKEIASIARYFYADGIVFEKGRVASRREISFHYRQKFSLKVPQVIQSEITLDGETDNLDGA